MTRIGSYFMSKLILIPFLPGLVRLVSTTEKLATQHQFFWEKPIVNFLK